jgi:NitT/TauT family transport system substrate-binding protein
MAIALREQGVPIKIVYLGHRDGTAMMVHKDSDIHRIEDLRGKKIAVPNRFSNQRLIIYRALKQRGIRIDEVTLLEMPPPDMPAALHVRAVDAVISGPFMAQAEMDGYGRVLFLTTKDVWPSSSPASWPSLKHIGIAGTRSSGWWRASRASASGSISMDHRLQAAEFAGKQYHHQDPALLRSCSASPRPGQVHQPEVLRKFRRSKRLGVESGILNGTAHFEDYADPSFVEDETASTLPMGGLPMSSIDALAVPEPSGRPRGRTGLGGCRAAVAAFARGRFLAAGRRRGIPASWDLSVRLSGNTLFPKPFDVALGILELVRQGLLFKYIVASLFRVTWGFTLAVVVGVPFGLMLGWFRRA